MATFVKPVNALNRAEELIDVRQMQAALHLLHDRSKNLTQKDLQLIASSVVLAALSVTPYDCGYGASHLERNLRMANITRSALLSELVSKGVMACASPEVGQLYKLLEHEFLPLDLARRVQPLLTKISSVGGKILSASPVAEVQLSHYIPALEKLATLRLLQQVSQVYQTMKIEVLSEMIPFFVFSVVEKLSVDAVKANFIAMKVDHQNGTVVFDGLDLGTDRLQRHLALLAEYLDKARFLINPPVEKASNLGEAMPGLADLVDKEHKWLRDRKSVIEKRKEDQERQMSEFERAEEAKRLNQQQAEAELNRLATQSYLREQLRIKREQEEQRIKREQEELKMTMNRKLEEIQELEKKFQKLAKNIDYMERAKREEEALLIEAAFQQRLVEERVAHEREQQQEVELCRERHVRDLQEKNRLSRMLETKMIFQR